MHNINKHVVALRVAIAAGIAAVILLFVAAFVFRDRPSLAQLYQEVDTDVKISLVGLVRAPARDASRALLGAERRLRKREGLLQRRLADVERAARSMARKGDQPQREESLSGADAENREALKRLGHSQERLAALRKRIGDWRQRLNASERSQREVVWTEICVEALTERLQWSPGAIPAEPRVIQVRALWQTFQAGISTGALWPARAVYNSVRHPGSDFGIVRRMLFPFAGRHVLRGMHIAGFVLAVFIMGYGFCWLGSRFDLATLSYCGLSYFVYMVIYAVCLVLLRVNVLAG